MTPEKKARQLVNRFYDINRAINDYSDISWATAEECARIAVDEILKEVNYFENINYWNQVKQEIDNL
jgi:hypothetical protein